MCNQFLDRWKGVIMYLAPSRTGKINRPSHPPTLFLKKRGGNKFLAFEVHFIFPIYCCLYNDTVTSLWRQHDGEGGMLDFEDVQLLAIPTDQLELDCSVHIHDRLPSDLTKTLTRSSQCYVLGCFSCVVVPRHAPRSWKSGIIDQSTLNSY